MHHRIHTQTQIPFLLSRRHASFHFSNDGRLMLSDMGSVNGTYVARRGTPLVHARRLPPGAPHQLEDGDVIGFGGPENIVARRVWVENPFIFSFSFPPGSAGAAGGGGIGPAAVAPPSGRQATATRQPAGGIGAAAAASPTATGGGALRVLSQRRRGGGGAADLAVEVPAPPPPAAAEGAGEDSQVGCWRCHMLAQVILSTRVRHMLEPPPRIFVYSRITS